MDSIITETFDFWKKNNGVRMNREEARQAVNNIAGFFQILNEWEQNVSCAEQSSNGNTTLKCDSKGK